MPALRMQGLVKRRLAVEIGINQDQNPMFIPHPLDTEELAQFMWQAAQSGAIRRGDSEPITKEECQAMANTFHSEFSYHKSASYRLQNGRVISRYHCPGRAVGGFGYNVYRVEGNETTFPTLREALVAAGFNVRTYRSQH